MKFLILASSPEAYASLPQAFLLALEALAQSNNVQLLAANTNALPYATVIDLPLPRKKIPVVSPSAAWRKACEPLVKSIDALDALDGIFIFDEDMLRAVTATRVPQAPLFWAGSFKHKTLPLYTTVALRLTTAILLPSTLDKQTLIERCEWRQCDPRTLPEILPSPTLVVAWQALLPILPGLSKPTLPARIEHALHAGALPLLGQGSRRTCHQLFDTGLCVKFYRPLGLFSKGAKFRVRFEIWRSAHDRARNTSCQEYDVLQKIERTKPAQLRTLFPEHLDLLYLPTYGWGLIETCITNADGTPSKRFPEILTDPATPLQMREAILKELDTLIDLLCAHTVPFYDLQNILVQTQADGSRHYRIADFEPRNRQILPLDTLPLLARKKIRRRYARTLKNILPKSPCKHSS
jgi:hypothetical protein